MEHVCRNGGLISPAFSAILYFSKSSSPVVTEIPTLWFSAALSLHDVPHDTLLVVILAPSPNSSDPEYVFMFDKDLETVRETKTITATIKYLQGKIQLTDLGKWMQKYAKDAQKEFLQPSFKYLTAGTDVLVQRFRNLRLSQTLLSASVGFESQTMRDPLAYPPWYYSRESRHKVSANRKDLLLSSLIKMWPYLRWLLAWGNDQNKISPEWWKKKEKVLHTKL